MLHSSLGIRSRLKLKWGEISGLQTGFSLYPWTYCETSHANNGYRVYALLRQELWGDAIKRFQRISYVHSRMTTAPAKAKI